MENWKRNLYVTWATQILSLAGFGFMLPFIPFFIQEVGVTDSEAVNRWVGIIASVPALALGFMAPIWGALADRFGRKVMILRSMGAGVVILLGMSFAQNVQTIFLLRMAQGFFTGTVTAAATLVAAGTPAERMSQALGFLSSSTFIGMSVGPMLGGLIAEYVGYRSAFRIGSAVLLLAFLAVLFLTRDVRAARAPHPHIRRDRAPRDRSFLAGLAMLLGLFFLIRFARALPNSFIPLHVQDLLGSIEGASATTGVVQALVGGAAAVAGLTVVRLGDRIDKLKLVFRLLLSSSVVAAFLVLTRTVFSFGAVFVLASFLMSGVEPTLQSYLSEHTESSRRGIIFGSVTMVGGLGWSAGPLLGSVISIRWGLIWLFPVFAVTLGLGCIYLRVYGTQITDRFRAASRNR